MTADARPATWRRVALGEVADLALGKMLDKAKRTRGTPMPYLRNINVRWNAFILDDVFEMPFENHELERYAVRAGDVVICEGGEPGRAAVWRGEPIMFQKALHRVRPHPSALDAQWLVWHLRHDAATGRLAESFTGTTIKHLTGSALARYEIALPPLRMQRHLVAKLEEVSGSGEAARTALRDAERGVPQYVRAVLGRAHVASVAAAAAARSTATLASMCGTTGLFTDGDWVESKDQDPDGGVRLIQLADIGDGIFRDRSARFLTLERAIELGCTFLEQGDVLVSRMADPLGRACVFPGAERPCVTAVDVCIIRPDRTAVDPRWLMHVINAPQVRDLISWEASGTTRKRISRSRLGEILLPSPSLEDQRRIASNVDDALRRVSSVNAAIRESTSSVSQLETVALMKALRGALVREALGD